MTLCGQIYFLFVSFTGCRAAAEHYLSSSNYMDCISSVTGSNGCSLNSSLKGSDLPELFSKLGLGKYTDVFQQQEVEWNKNPSLVVFFFLQRVWFDCYEASM